MFKQPFKRPRVQQVFQQLTSMLSRGYPLPSCFRRLNGCLNLRGSGTHVRNQLRALWSWRVRIVCKTWVLNASAPGARGNILNTWPRPEFFLDFRFWSLQKWQFQWTAVEQNQLRSPRAHVEEPFRTSMAHEGMAIAGIAWRKGHSSWSGCICLP